MDAIFSAATGPDAARRGESHHFADGDHSSSSANMCRGSTARNRSLHRRATCARSSPNRTGRAIVRLLYGELTQVGIGPVGLWISVCCATMARARSHADVELGPSCPHISPRRGGRNSSGLALEILRRIWPLRLRSNCLNESVSPGFVPHSFPCPVRATAACRSYRDRAACARQ